ncbi:hypothetical protein SAMN06295933_2335 [Desulfovibrio gilichinskyi]|uniref:Cxxc_20_cxxc protein n=1 Tax=Desulfovibrio gilichinskyi TaxID=1519643 RepID=A0A1X7DXY8_9BACT|nr:hypothetical protein SAMN06295933_2335 [Desulfovibrio gilichinskyi]
MISDFIFILFACFLTIGLMHYKKNIICNNCGERFKVIPNKYIGIMWVLLFCAMALDNILNYSCNFSILDFIVGASGVYYLLKKDKKKCPKCKNEIV